MERKEKKGGRTTAGGEKVARKGSGPPPPEEVAPAASPHLVPVVGVGASAGGIEAISRLLEAMPPSRGFAIVLVVHRDPRYQGGLEELFAKRTGLTVVQAEHRLAVEPDTVYVIPPNAYLALQGNRFRVDKPVLVRGTRLPIDHFFHSLGEERREQAVAVILTGTASDGALGLKTVKELGGMVMAQDPATALHDSMPRSAIATGLVDHVLAVEEMPAAIVDYLRHPLLNRVEATRELSVQEKAALNEVLSLLRFRTKHDFRGYKKTTLFRRILRRLSINRLEGLQEYLDFLRTTPQEIDLLKKDLLINVTSWFRDQEAWQQLEAEVIPRLFERPEKEEPVRAWIAGCATGEEAYSLAILFHEYLEGAGQSRVVQIFATDVDQEALEIARQGSYSRNIENEVDAKRLSRFFDQQEGAFRVKKRLRESVIFALHNLIADPPFSRLDLICCRNLLIYLDTEVQQRILPLFHFALREGGFLFLGPSETTSQAQHLFRTVSKKWRLYKRIGSAIAVNALQLPSPREETGQLFGQELQTPAVAGTFKLAETARRVLLERYVPASVLIDRKGRALYFHGSHEKYLVQPAGEPTTNILDMAREGLKTRLRGAVQQAADSEQEIVAAGVRLRLGDRYQPVRITVLPFQRPHQAEGLLLVTFEDEERPQADIEGRQPCEGDVESVVKQLEEELHATIGDLETSNEELRSSNEEILSMNEELQSSNEELETSKEELQSINEELTTLNAQLAGKIQDLEEAHADLDNLMRSTQIACLFLDEELRIKRFTAAAATIFSLLPTDCSRPLADLDYKRIDPDLLVACRRVLDTLATEEKEVSGDGGMWYLRRILPYRDQEQRIRGVVVTFANVSQLKAAEERLEASQLAYRRLVDNNPDGICQIDQAGAIRTANPALARMLGYPADELVGRPLVAFLAPDSQQEEAAGQLTDALRKGTPPVCCLQVLRKDGGHGMVELYALSTGDSGNKDGGLWVHLRDISSRQQLEDVISRSRLRVYQTLDAIPALIASIDRDERYLFASRGHEDYTGKAPQEMAGATLREALDDEAYRVLQPRVAAALAGERQDFELELCHRQDGPRLHRAVLVPDVACGQAACGCFFLAVDITGDKETLSRLEERDRLLEAIMTSIPEGIAVAEAPDMRIRMISAHGVRMTGQEEAFLKDASVLQQVAHWRLFQEDGKTPLAIERMPLARAITAGETTDNQALVMKTPDGRDIPILCSAAPLRDAAGGISGGILAWREVTELKREVERLTQLAFILEQTPHMVGCATPDGQIVYLNQAARRMAGIAPDAPLAGETVDRHQPPWVQRLLSEEGIPAAIRDGVWQGETAVLAADGREIPCAQLVIARKDPQGEVRYLSTVLHDLSAILDEKKRLESMVSRLEKSNEDLGELGYVVSHDLKEPLRSIAGYLDLYVRRYGEGLEPKARQFLDFARQGAARLERLIDDLLQLTRLRRTDLAPASVDMNLLLDEVLSQLSAQIDEAGAEVTCDELLPVTGIASQLSLVLQNLVANGIKFAAPGRKPAIHIGCQRNDQGVVTSVRDNGIGIDPKHRQRIFQVFQRLHRQEDYPGTGIGLALCRRIVQNHGGEIWLESTPGEGATFFFSIPDPA
ncbi:MAG: CheR family methyltransferase [Thermodesulfobacteriota bacterium]